MYITLEAPYFAVRFTSILFYRVLDMVAMSSEDFKTWLNGLQLVLHLGSEAATKV